MPENEVPPLMGPRQAARLSRLDYLTQQLKLTEAIRESRKASRKEALAAEKMTLNELANLIGDRLRRKEISTPDFVALAKLLVELTTTSDKPKYRLRDVRDRILKAKSLKRKVTKEEREVLKLERQIEETKNVCI